MRPINLDLDVLRTFVAGFELGSFARAAERLGRSQSALSTQLRKLEQQVGSPVVRRAGRGLELTAAGETVLDYARRLLELNDEAVESLRGAGLEGWVRLGLAQDFAETWLPAALQRFARAHPRVRVEVQVDRSVPLIERTARRELDLALVWDQGPDTPTARHLADVPLRWIGPEHWSGPAADPGRGAGAGAEIPLVAFAPPCVFRTAATEALDAAGLRWHLSFTSPSLAGLRAAMAAGLGITARTAIDRPAGLTVLDPVATGLPPLPRMRVALLQAEAVPPPAARRFAAILLDRLRDDLGEEIRA